MIKSLGDYEGGLLCLEDGRKIDLRHRPFYFQGHKIKHWVEPFVGERYTVVYYNSVHFHPITRTEFPCDSKVMAEIFKKGEYTKYFGQEYGECWADIGANIGAFTLRNAMNGIKSISFEPDPGNFNVLIQNAINPDLCYNRAVVSKAEGQVQLYVSKNSPWNNTIFRPVRGRTCINVDTISFIDATAGCDCVKMDIEGGEFDIIDNCDLSGFKKIIIAYHINYDHSRFNFLARIEKLEKYYTVNHSTIPDAEYLDFFPNEIMVYCLSK
jgi:FkbM family methyltransferase